MGIYRKSAKRDQMLKIISNNLTYLRTTKFPGKGGRKKCADALGIKQQQWLPWERGLRIPNEQSLEKIAEVFEVSLEYLKTDNSNKLQDSANEGNNVVNVKKITSKVDASLGDKATEISKALAALDPDELKARKTILRLDLLIVGVELL